MKLVINEYQKYSENTEKGRKMEDASEDEMEKDEDDEEVISVNEMFHLDSTATEAFVDGDDIEDDEDSADKSEFDSEVDSDSEDA